jgi:hypothetical protein
MLGVLNVRTGNTITVKTVGTSGEPAININGRKLTNFCVFNNIRITNSFLNTKSFTNLHGVLMDQNQ